MPVLPAAEDPASDGDSDTSSDAPAYEAHYRPISTDAPSDDDDDDGGHISTVHSNGHPPPNPTFLHDHPENGVSHLDLNCNGAHAGEQREEEDDEEAAAAAAEEEEREREREASISRAFSEDESRRNAPLTRENAARIVEAMRGVPFPGCPPEWADRVPEDRWVDHLRRLRRGSSAPAPES